MNDTISNQIFFLFTTFRFIINYPQNKDLEVIFTAGT